MLMNSLVMASGDLNLTALPDILVSRLTLPNSYVSGIFATLIVFIIFVLPCLYYGNFPIAFMVFELVLIFATVLGWLSTYVLLINFIIIASMFAYGLLDKLTGG